MYVYIYIPSALVFPISMSSKVMPARPLCCLEGGRVYMCTSKRACVSEHVYLHAYIHDVLFVRASTCCVLCGVWCVVCSVCIECAYMGLSWIPTFLAEFLFFVVLNWDHAIDLPLTERERAWCDRESLRHHRNACSSSLQSSRA